METAIVDVNINKEVADAERTRLTMANSFALANAVMRELIGVQLSNSKDIDLDDYLQSSISNQLYKTLK